MCAYVTELVNWNHTCVLSGDHIYTTINFTDEFSNVSVTLMTCVGDGSERGWLGVVGVVDTRLVQKSRLECKTVNVYHVPFTCQSY